MSEYIIAETGEFPAQYNVLKKVMMVFLFPYSDLT